MTALLMSGLPLICSLFLLIITFSAIKLHLELFLTWGWTSFLLSVVLYLFYRFYHKRRVHFSERQFLWLAAGLFLVTRLCWLILIPSLPFSDFENYRILATHFSQGRPFQEQIHWSLLSYGMGYPLTLGGWLAVFGTGLAAAKALNLLLGLLSLFLFYKIAHKIDPASSQMAALLFVAWPSQMAFSSVLASEHLALALFLAGLLFLLEALQRPQASWAALVPAGALFALGYTVRSALAAGLLASVLVLLTGDACRKDKLLKISFFLAGFALTFSIYLGGVTAVYRITPVSQGYSTLLSGTNIESGGSWNEADGTRYIDHGSFEEANRDALDESIRRIRSNPGGFLILMMKKAIKTWRDETYGVEWSTLQRDRLWISRSAYQITEKTSRIASQLFQIFVLFFAFAGSLRLYVQKTVRREYLFIFILLASVTLLHSVIESQPRYHYWVEPMLFLLAAYGLVITTTSWRHPIRASLQGMT